VTQTQSALCVTDADSDDALMVRVRARDAAAFRILVERHVRPLHRIAYRMIGDATEAEDLAQEALLRLWRDAAKWQAGSAGTGAWLNRVVVNQCLDRLRRRRFGSDAEVPERADETPLAPDAMDAARMRAATVAAIAALPDRQRAAIVLTYYEEVSNQVAAEAMDMNIKAFESLLLRARTALRTALTPMKEAAR
jgi:RNA polymerase sigma factor (sigma-70 family)